MTWIKSSWCSARCRWAGSLPSLQGPQIENEGAGILARKAKHRHVGMTHCQPFAQSVHEGVEIDPALERAECGGAGMGALASRADRMTLRAHPFGKDPATLFQVARRILLGEARRYSEQHQRDCEPCDHFARFSAHLAIGLGVAGPFRRRSEAHRRPAPEAGERVEVRVILVRPAAQHREPTERAMLKPSRLRGHGREGAIYPAPGSARRTNRASRRIRKSLRR